MLTFCIWDRDWTDSQIMCRTFWGIEFNEDVLVTSTLFGEPQAWSGRLWAHTYLKPHVQVTIKTSPEDELLLTMTCEKFFINNGPGYSDQNRVPSASQLSVLNVTTHILIPMDDFVKHFKLQRFIKFDRERHII